MANYEGAFTTPLGDMLSHYASKTNMTRGELEKTCEIEAVKVSAYTIFGDAKDDAIKKFNNLTSKYTFMTDLKEGLAGVGVFGFIGESYFINATGVKYRKKRNRKMK